MHWLFLSRPSAPFLNTCIPYLNTYITYLNTLTRLSAPYLNTLIRLHILIHCRNIAYLNTWLEDPSRLSAAIAFLNTCGSSTPPPHLISSDIYYSSANLANITIEGVCRIFHLFNSYHLFVNVYCQGF